MVRTSISLNPVNQVPDPASTEILTHILSHLHPDSHATVSLVSKRFYELVTTSHAWRMAFLRYFPGHSVLESKSAKSTGDFWTDEPSDVIKSEARYFTRLTALATWRSEYLFRTRLLRSLTRGKPGGGIGSSMRTNQSGKKISAVLTYNSKLPWIVTHIHAIFANGKKPPKALHGQSHLGFVTMSDPTSGKMEKWNLGGPWGFLQLHEVAPGLEPYGVGEGPAATPNVMDVSAAYGLLAGEGFPGGRPFFRSVSENTGRYLGGGSGVVDTYPEIPKIPEMSEGICSVWLAKSSAVPLATQSMVGILTGSTLGVVTAYALHSETGGFRYTNGEITTRWILSPGVPIIALKVDDNYNQKRKSSARIWAVALNALGEVYYLTETPTTSPNRISTDDVTKNAWYAGRSAYWHLMEATRRSARPDDLDKNAVRGAYSPRSPSNSMNLGKGQLTAEAREIEKFLLHKPSHFRKVCEGWDMQRRLEVDFSSDDSQGAGENMFVIDCGLVEGRSASVQRYSRSLSQQIEAAKNPEPVATMPSPSLFGSLGIGAGAASNNDETPEPQTPLSPPSTPMPSDSTALHEWSHSSMELKDHENAVITAVALDCSSHALLTHAEDHLHPANEASLPGTPRGDQHVMEIPGRRARHIAVGTKTGAVILWNSRDPASAVVSPQRLIQTDSPEITSLALTSLFVIHGGSDGLVQAWDPLASTFEPVRTLNAKSNIRVPRQMMAMNPPPSTDRNSCAVGAIYLDPDPTVLRGIVAFGAFLRYWSYSSTSHPTGRKRRHRQSDMHGRLASRRQGGTVHGYIAAEAAEMAREEKNRIKEQTRLRNRFGVGTLDLTEEEALQYAQLVSQEAFLMQEQRRASDSAADASLDTASSFSETTVDTITPEPSIADVTTPPAPIAEEDEYEQQIQQAIRLSLMEGVNEPSQSPRGISSGEYEFSVQYRKPARKSKKSTPTSPEQSYTPVMGVKKGSSSRVDVQDDDFELALALSMADQDPEAGYRAFEEFPPLDNDGPGKGKGVQRW